MLSATVATLEDVNNNHNNKEWLLNREGPWARM